MKIQTRLLRKTALAAAVTLVIGGVASMSSFMGIETGMSSIVSTAYAAKGDGQGAMGAGGQGGQGGQAAGGQGQRGGGQGQRGGKSVADVLADEADDDSDRPAWAGVPGNEGKPGGGNAGGDTQKGGDYGDLFVVLRDDDGNPVTDGNEVYVLLSDGTVVKTVDGEVPAEYLALAQPVEFGRMNIARSPASVLEHSLTEALSKLDGLTIDATNIADLTDASGRLLTTDGLTIDSPLENLALYEALLTAKDTDGDGLLELSVTASKDGADSTYTLLVDPSVRLDLAASAIAASSDKTGALSADEIVLISSFMGVDDELGALAVDFTYDKDAAFANETVSILVDPEGDGTYITVTDTVLQLIADYGDNVFNTLQQPVVQAYENEDAVVYADELTGVYLFTQAADDAVQVLEFVHDSSAP